MAEKYFEESIYIQTMRFAEMHRAGFTSEALLRSLVADEKTKEIIEQYIHNADLNFMSYDQTGSLNPTKETIFVRVKNRDVSGASTPFYILTSTAFFDYLSHVGLDESRTSSRSAQKWSMVALGVSILSFIGSIYIQLTSRTTLDQKQFETITHEQKISNQNVEKAIEEQKLILKKLESVEKIVQ